jgi:hypothetical protein
MGKVYAQYYWLTLPGLAMKSKCHVASAAAHIHHTGVRPSEDVSEGPGGSSPPQTINIEREEMIEKVVTRRDGAKHLADGAGCCISICGALRRSTNYSAFGLAAHG